jgi:hypothetical protein
VKEEGGRGKDEGGRRKEEGGRVFLEYPIGHSKNTLYPVLIFSLSLFASSH